MNIVLIMSETNLWKPHFISQIIKKLKPPDKITGAVLITFKPANWSFKQYFNNYFSILGIKASFLISLMLIKYKTLNLIDKFVGLSNSYNIESVCRKNAIPVYFAKDINAPCTLDWIKSKNPDIIFNSGHQIFKQELLSIPKVASINRHSSLLPSYRGVYPIFWSMLNDEKYVGVTFHTMDKEIDKGGIIAQDRIEIHNDDTFFSLFQKCYDLSVDLFLKSLEILRNGNWSPLQNNFAPSYFSFPTSNDAKLFRKKGKRII